MFFTLFACVGAWEAICRFANISYEYGLMTRIPFDSRTRSIILGYLNIPTDSLCLIDRFRLDCLMDHLSHDISRIILDYAPDQQSTQLISANRNDFTALDFASCRFASYSNQFLSLHQTQSVIRTHVSTNQNRAKFLLLAANYIYLVFSNRIKVYLITRSLILHDTQDFNLKIVGAKATSDGTHLLIRQTIKGLSHYCAKLKRIRHFSSTAYEFDHTSNDTFRYCTPFSTKFQTFGHSCCSANLKDKQSCSILKLKKFFQFEFMLNTFDLKNEISMKEFDEKQMIITKDVLMIFNKTATLLHAFYYEKNLFGDSVRVEILDKESFVVQINGKQPKMLYLQLQQKPVLMTRSYEKPATIIIK